MGPMVTVNGRVRAKLIFETQQTVSTGFFTGQMKLTGKLKDFEYIDKSALPHIHLSEGKNISWVPF